MADTFQTAFIFFFSLSVHQHLVLGMVKGAESEKQRGVNKDSDFLPKDQKGELQETA